MKDTNKILVWGAVGLGAGFALSYMLREKEEYHVKNKVVLITGGSRGLGLNLARQLLAEGAKVAICARSEKELENAALELNMIDEVLAIQCDVTDKWQVDAMMDEIRDNLGSVDVLINCAGIIQVGPFENMTVDDFDDAMKIHFWGPLYTSMSVLEDMKAKGGGRIVNISSIGGKVTVPHLLPYISSKFALTGFSQGLRTELKKYNILVSTITPGLMRTGSIHNITLKGQHEKEYAGFSIMSAMPLITVSAGYAARRIIKALKRGEGSVTISFPAKLLAAFYQRFPGFSTDLFALINQIMPDPTASNKGKRSEESYSKLSPSILTVMSDHAAIDNNQI
jgi:NAD(P)-dependent dehydrogenase (short-subunit alcohol dehydrogenase family)